MPNLWLNSRAKQWGFFPTPREAEGPASYLMAYRYYFLRLSSQYVATFVNLRAIFVTCSSLEHKNEKNILHPKHLKLLKKS